ncbi:hypothetical protein A2696_02600 [Candidatus Curtissbacteria bacterium RIFCSPHIGHO2_01_FULL_41_13]|uniref:Transcription elongation factor GreA n=2 Tax=Microgenomates group TaxID=1794810 RepID=A0A1F5G2I0_9BACT|nr:MAG: hypothetical protein A2696_02600 [Candidatus Curtissbacteria bacterium RIFCSPHIGHO2_01_FULL_41_13]OGK41574.1 MAG: hypothetical protein A3A74_08125 [Candidatus Roizmanbacteria bacterium RIFCSPLOWO2_01_FULL_35_13]
MKKPLDIQITKQGLENLKKEHDDLENKRPGVVERMSQAREQGDLAENAGYHAAKEALAYIDYRLRELKLLIRNAHVIETKQNDIVSLGSTVTIASNGKQTVYTIVGKLEADPANGRLSEASPIGSALLGKKVGASVEVKTPIGKIVNKIIEIK